MIGSTFNWPVEDDCAVFTKWVCDVPSNSPKRYVVVKFVSPNRTETAFFQVLTGLIPVACDDVDVVSKCQGDEVSTCEAAVSSSQVGMFIVDMHSSAAPNLLTSTIQPSSGDVRHGKFYWLALWQ